MKRILSYNIDNDNPVNGKLKSNKSYDVLYNNYDNYENRVEKILLENDNNSIKDNIFLNKIINERKNIIISKLSKNPLNS